MTANSLPPIQVLKYRNTGFAFNLGDTIQAVALARLLGPDTEGVYRDAAGRADPDRLFVVSGWLGDRSVPARGENTLFAGIHLGACRGEQLRWIRKSRFPVGARDPHTYEMLVREGIRSEMTGCVSLTLPRYEGPRTGRYAIDANADCSIPKNAVVMTQTGLAHPWHEQVALANARLETLRTAEIVYTSRLHVALPCLAFGTPVVVAITANQPERFSLFEGLGGTYYEPVVIDVSRLATRFRAFLTRGMESYHKRK